MTIDEVKRIYIAAGGPDDHGQVDWVDIHREIEQVIAAKTDFAGGRIIDWWACWDREYTATAFARRVRQAARKNMP